MISRIRFVFLFFSVAFIAQSTWAKPGVARLSSPHMTVENHLLYLQEDSYQPEVSAKSFQWSQDFSEEDKEEIAVKLKQIYDGSGHWIDLDDIPQNANYKDTTTELSEYIVVQEFPKIYVKKYGNKWLYSPETVKWIPKIHKQVYPYGTDKLLNFLPKIGNHEIWGMHAWQYVGLLIILTLAITAQKILSFVFDRVLIRVFRRKNHTIEDTKTTLFLKTARPLSWLATFFILAVLIPVLQLPSKMGAFVIIGLKSSIPILFTFAFYRFVDIIAHQFEKRAQTTESQLDDQLVPILRKTLKAFVLVIGSLYVLQNFNVNITTLLAGLSIGGLAIALAAQDTLKNFFGSIMIFLDRPFQIGDWIIASGIDGSVEEVGFRATRIRTFYNSLVYVPNGKLADMTVDNMGKRFYRRYKTILGIHYDTPHYLIEAFTKGLEQIVIEHEETRKDYYNIYFNDFNASQLDILFYIFINTPTWPDELRVRHELNLEIIKLAKKLGVNFAFPTQTLHMENFPGQVSNSPNYMTEEEVQKIAAIEGMKTKNAN